MEFNKCIRCGCFFSHTSNICPNCISKDLIEKQKLESYLDNFSVPDSIEQLSYNTGISEKNLQHFIQSNEFSDLNKYKL